MSTPPTHRRTPEPVLNAGLLIALLEAVIAALVAFGVSVTPDQHTAIIGLAGAVLAVISAVVPALAARSRVTPVSEVVERRAGGDVVAGEGHEDIPDGVKIRAVHDA